MVSRKHKKALADLGLTINDVSAHAIAEPRQMAYEITRRQYLSDRGTTTRRSKHNKIKTDSFKE